MNSIYVSWGSEMITEAGEVSDFTAWREKIKTWGGTETDQLLVKQLNHSFDLVSSPKPSKPQILNNDKSFKVRAHTV